MSKKTYLPEQIINKLREVEVFISQGATAIYTLYLVVVPIPILILTVSQHSSKAASN